jgi:hypothetical protein
MVDARPRNVASSNGTSTSSASLRLVSWTEWHSPTTLTREVPRYVAMQFMAIGFV